MSPDIITTAKGLTNGVIPMGAVSASEDPRRLHARPGDAIELFHGYTYSGHPLPAAAGIATMDVYEEEGIFTAPPSRALLARGVAFLRACRM